MRKKQAMDLRKLKKLIDLVEESGISELEVSEGEEKVRIVKHSSNVAQSGYMMPPVAPSAALPARANAPVLPTGNGAEKSDGQTVRSPMVGTFYRSASLGSEPLVQVGSAIKSGNTLCIVEALQVRNEIMSEFSGTVSAILVDNGRPVEYGEPLFIIV